LRSHLVNNSLTSLVILCRYRGRLCSLLTTLLPS